MTARGIILNVKKVSFTTLINNFSNEEMTDIKQMAILIWISTPYPRFKHNTMNCRARKNTGTPEFEIHEKILNLV